MINRLVKPFRNWITRTPSMLLTNVLLTHRCTQNCLQCTIPQQKTENEFMPFADFQIVLERLIKQGTLGITLSGGEPMLHPEIEKFVDYAHKRGFLRLHILTTLYYPESFFIKLLGILEKYPFSMSCSFDGFGETADHLRGGKDVAAIVEGNMRKLTSHLQSKGIKRRLGINIVCNALNVNQIPEIIKLVEELGWRANLDIYRWLSNNQNECDELKHKDMAAIEELVKLAVASKAVWTPAWLMNGYTDYLRGNFKKICPYLSMPSLGSKFFINPDGEVEVCSGSPVGNILQQTPPEIFASEVWKAKLEQFRQCKGCWNTCYTMSAGAFRYKYLKDILKALKMAK
ncbi:MAG: radical SAM protein [Candidatus Cloacimonetes bacterium]|nr:radical SAM protein [Candidatus Cloacimonadota bacterium]